MNDFNEFNSAIRHYLTYPRILVKGDFQESYLGVEPIAFTNIMKAWKAYPKWTLAFLRETFTKAKIIADRREARQVKFFQFTFQSYLDYMIENSDPNPYYGKTAIHLSTFMKDEYDATSYFRCWYREWYSKYPSEERKLKLSNIFLGPTHGRSLLHIDIWGTSFWNALFEGLKLWVFFDSKDDKYLYSGAVDPFSPDAEKYPDFFKATPKVYLQQPGELIYCPGNVWHAVYSLKPSLALSENFINGENYKNVLEYFRSAGQFNAYKKMEKIATEFGC